MAASPPSESGAGADTPAPAAIDPVTPARWGSLRRFTDARIALGRAGPSLPTDAHLAFQLAHAQARDAVHLPFDALGTAAALEALGLETLPLHSAAADRPTYLQRPDLGRRLDEASRQRLAAWNAARERRVAAGSAPDRHELAFVVADGLSALAIHRNAAALIAATLDLLRADAAQTWRVAPVAVVEQGRVAIGDEIGAALNANTVVVLIGERPGLSSPDSLGCYLTWAPRIGLTDASRNCISNIRPAGLAVDAAASKLQQLLTRSRALQLTGVGLKDDRDDLAPAIGAGPAAGGSGNFLLARPKP